jgi:hypothetical protein
MQTGWDGASEATLSAAQPEEPCWGSIRLSKRHLIRANGTDAGGSCETYVWGFVEYSDAIAELKHLKTAELGIIELICLQQK